MRIDLLSDISYPSVRLSAHDKEKKRRPRQVPVRRDGTSISELTGWEMTPDYDNFGGDLRKVEKIGRSGCVRKTYG